MYLYSGVQINLRVNLNSVRMGFIARSIFVGKFIISRLKTCSFKFSVFAKQEEAASRGESCNGQA